MSYLCSRLFQTLVTSLLCTAVTFKNMNINAYIISSRTSRTDKISAGWEQFKNIIFEVELCLVVPIKKMRTGLELDLNSVSDSKILSVVKTPSRL